MFYCSQITLNYSAPSKRLLYCMEALLKPGKLDLYLSFCLSVLLLNKGRTGDILNARKASKLRNLSHYIMEAALTYILFQMNTSA